MLWPAKSPPWATTVPPWAMKCAALMSAKNDRSLEAGVERHQVELPGWPVKLPTITWTGSEPVWKTGGFTSLKKPLPRPCRKRTSFDWPSLTRMSGMPSPLRSVTTVEVGPLPALSRGPATSVQLAPEPWPRRIERSLDP